MANGSGVTPSTALQAITFSPSGRYLGPITALMAIDENGSDRLTITQHPVELGASITDHAYMEPAELTMHMMATNSGVAAAGDAQYVENVYNQLLALQASRVTFPIQTGKRLYQDMLITSLDLMTNEQTEHALMLTVGCRQILKVKTQIVAITDPSVQADPEKTAPVTQTGTKQAVATTAEIVVPTPQGLALRTPPPPASP